MDDGGQRVLGGDAGQQRGERVAVGDVAGRDGDLRRRAPASSATSSAAPGAPGPRRLVSSRCRTPCSVTRCRASSAPRVPVPPVISTVPSGSGAGGHGEHDLADVPGLAEEAERLGGLADVPGRDRQRPQHAALEQVAAARSASPGSGPGPPRSGRTPGSATPGWSAATLLGVADVGLAHLHEAAAARQQPQRGVDELAGQGVQHDVHAAAAGGGAGSVPRSPGCGRRRCGRRRRPWPRSVSHLPGLAVAKTSAPRCRASWTAAMPTPPVAAWTSTRLARAQPAEVDQRRSRRSGRRSASDAACANVQPSGTRATQPVVGRRVVADRAVGQQAHHPVAGGESGRRRGRPRARRRRPRCRAAPRPGTCPGRSARRGS